MRDGDPANHVIENLTPGNPLPVARYTQHSQACRAMAARGSRLCRNPRWNGLPVCEFHFRMSQDRGVVYV